jgi:hypothetical protein
VVDPDVRDIPVAAIVYDLYVARRHVERREFERIGEAVGRDVEDVPVGSPLDRPVANPIAPAAIVAVVAIVFTALALALAVVAVVVVVVTVTGGETSRFTRRQFDEVDVVVGVRVELVEKKELVVRAPATGEQRVSPPAVEDEVGLGAHFVAVLDVAVEIGA